MRNRMIVIMLLVAFIAAGGFSKVYASKKYATSGGNNSRGILWNYNKKTKTLTISPNKGKKISKQNLDDLEICKRKAEKVVYKRGVKTLYPTFYPYEDGTFRNYPKLKKAEIAGTVKRIDNEAFDGCDGLKQVIIHNGVEYIGESSFKHTSIDQIILPRSVKCIGDDAFCFSICSNMILNDGIKYIGSFAFQDSKLDNVSFPDSVEFIDFGALSGAEQLTDVNLPQNIKVLRPFLFSNTELKNCDIPETVVSIEDGVFSKTGLEKIVIPRNVENLGSSHDRRKYDGYEGDESENQGILYGCSQLKVLSIMTRKLKNVYSCAMSGINPNATIEVPIGYKDKYTEMFKQGGLPDGVKIVEIEVNDSDLDSMRLNKTKLKLKAKCNRKLELMYTDEPDKVVWKSSNSKVVKIDSSGNARSVAPGKAKITAIYKNHKYVCKVTVTKADANNDEAELKKLIKKQRRWGNLRVSTNIHSKQYKWKKGRLVAIKWSDTEAIGKINLNPFTYLETFDISEAWDDGDCSRLGQYICEIYADDLKHLKKIDLSETFHKRDLPDEFIHTENSPNVKVIREAEDLEYNGSKGTFNVYNTVKKSL